ncbi:Mn2+ and Fe2+ transporters of the NRAMP family [Catalinimonas alkaloidigena]|uniref:Mn2+ and Fe2+ transporters of the NRAMP family n=1 Tax=Catalinimonas alkaloidigena TaxID=1075417 RepID=A0A1G9R8H6_9BACT|nr:Nramp family divalent metal transporter [Catalinimonas alkaloidigena]SDM19533.1 Mn2+ and Fe2+ transporters of the NRAMP family [Catalinimonas alkaloidigena]
MPTSVQTPATQEPPRSFGGTLRQLGPGIIIAGSIVGSGELIATTTMGAVAGFWLLWLVVIGCVIKVFTQIEFGRHTLTWNETALEALNSVPGPRWKVNWIVWAWAVMTLLVVSQQGGIIGGVGQALAISQPLTEEGVAYNAAKDAWIEAQVDAALQSDAQPVAASEAGAALPEPIDAYLWAIGIALLTSVLMYIGRYGFIQTLSTVLVASFTLITLITLALLQGTDWAVQSGEVATGLRFQLPPLVEGLTENPAATALATFGLIGIGSGELIMYPYWCLEKGYARHTGPREHSTSWTTRARGWLRVLRIDAWVSMVVYTFATVAFYLLGAAVLGRTGLHPAGPDMIRTLAQMYVPVFGSWAQGLFLFGAFAVLYSTFFVVSAGYSRLVADGLGLFGWTDGSPEARERWSRRLSVVWPLAALSIFLFVKAPVTLVLAGGMAQAVMLPLLGVAALYFRYRRSEPTLRSGLWWDVMLWLSFLGFVLVGGWSVYNALAG